MKLLVVEDDRLLSKVLVSGLKKAGYAVDVAFDGEEALYQYEQNSYDVIVLDLSLPVLDGFQVLETIRKTDTKTNILILSARVMLEDKLKGFDLGSNDYMSKPFDFLELLARINALTRRSYLVSPSVLAYRGLQLDQTKKELRIQEQPLALTKKEFGILEYLLLHQDEVISSEVLIEHIWESDADLFSNAFHFHMSSLRKKIKQHTDQTIIKTIRGQGYIIERDVS